MESREYTLAILTSTDFPFWNRLIPRPEVNLKAFLQSFASGPFVIHFFVKFKNLFNHHRKRDACEFFLLFYLLLGFLVKSPLKNENSKGAKMNRTLYFTIFTILLVLFLNSAWAMDGLIPAFKLEPNDLELARGAQPHTYCDKVGRKFAILGYENGSFEAWAYPLKILRNFEFSFLIGSSTQPIQAADIVRCVSVTPAATTLTYTFQPFTVKAIYITSVEEPGAVILLDVDTTEPLTIVASFLPVLQPMWPAGIGGQYAYWDENLKAYLISEPTRKNHGYVGSPAAQGISYTPAHMLSDTPNQFKIVVEKAEDVRGKFIPIILAGGKGKREDVKSIYERLASNPEAQYRLALEHYRKLRADTLKVETPEKKINLAFEWAKVAYDNLVVENPDLGKGLVAGLGTSGTGGRPGFGWFFGTDSYLNSLSLNSYGAYEATKEALTFTQKWQRQDGKMAHELSQAAGYLNWFGDYPYGYIHGDTTPFYIAAMYDYYKMSGDLEYVKKSWASLRRAFDWCLKTDGDGDGLMDNKKAGLGALEFGSLTGIQTDIYLAAIWVRATYAMQYLAQAAGDKTYAKKAAEYYQKALCAYDSKFWDEETQQYSYAFNLDGNKVKELTPWCALGMIWGIGDPSHTALTLERMNSSELTTDWGVRILSDKSNLFEPLNYNYGAVWPFLTGYAATAQFKNSFILQGYHSLMSVVHHTFDNALGNVTELFSGHQNIWPQEAVAHQGFSTGGVVLPLVRGLLGLEGDAVEKRIIFEPRFPANWPEVWVKDYRIGGHSFSFRYQRSEDKVKMEANYPKSSTYKMIFAPALGLGTNIRGASVNGRPALFKTEMTQSSQVIQPVVEFDLSGSDVVEIDFDAAPEILPPDPESQTGDSNKGLKIIKQELQENKLKVIVEGLSRQVYKLGLANTKLIESVTGAALEGDDLVVQMPEGKESEFVRHQVILKMKRD